MNWPHPYPPARHTVDQPCNCGHSCHLVAAEASQVSTRLSDVFGMVPAGQSVVLPGRDWHDGRSADRGLTMGQERFPTKELMPDREDGKLWVSGGNDAAPRTEN